MTSVREGDESNEESKDSLMATEGAILMDKKDPERIRESLSVCECDLWFRKNTPIDRGFRSVAVDWKGQ